jgi:anion-transporting  ArsA/GET3 family ATPase
VGCGGVGKTTLAAALALEAARRGRRAVVLTIDPARRLADALGVAELGNRPQAIPREALRALGAPEEGSLSALMLDMKRTFDDLVERFADSPEARARILDNRIYQHASDALAGSVEYSAMEKVYELAESGGFDLIVVDTPPAQHALDFLEAPQRLLEFLDSRIVQILIHPAFAAGRFGFRLFQRSTRRVLQVLERVSGFSFLEDVSEFLLAFEGMSEGFRDRARRVRSLLLGPDASFVLVAGPERESVEQAGRFLDRLEATRVPLAGLLVNRVRHWPEPGEPPELARAGAADTAALASALRALGGGRFAADEAARAALRAATGYASLVRRDARATRALRERTEAQGRFYCEVPELEQDVHDLAGLANLADRVFRGGAKEPSLAGEEEREERRTGRPVGSRS